MVRFRVTRTFKLFQALMPRWGRKASFDAKMAFSKAPSPLGALPLATVGDSSVAISAATLGHGWPNALGSRRRST